MSFSLDPSSRANLAGVHPALVRVVKAAIRITRQEFRVHEGLRSLSQQRVYIARGTDWTLRTRHLRQPDGFAHAVDLVPLIRGELRWDWPACRRIALAMAEAAAELQIMLRWGGAWDRPMSVYATSYAAIERESIAYLARRKALGKRANLQGPHFELIR